MWPNSDTLNNVFDKVNTVYTGSVNKLDDGKNYILDNTVDNSKKIWDATTNQYNNVKNYIDDHIVSGVVGNGDGHGEGEESQKLGSFDWKTTKTTSVVVFGDDNESESNAAGLLENGGNKLYDLGGKLVRKSKGLFYNPQDDGFDDGKYTSTTTIISNSGIRTYKSNGDDSKLSKIFFRKDVFDSNGNQRYKLFGNDKYYLSASTNELIYLVGGLTASILAIYGFQKYCYSRLNKKVHYLSYKDFNNQIVLVLGSMVDPITRAQVHDLYRKGYIIYVCTPSVDVDGDNEDYQETNYYDENDGDYYKKNYGHGEEDDEWVKSSEEFQNNDSDMIRLNYISSKPKDLAKFIKSIQIRNWNLKAIILSHNNISNNNNLKNFENGINNNLMDLIKVLYKMIPVFTNLKIILFNPSLSLLTESSIKCNQSSLEILSSNIITGLFNTISKIEGPKYNHQIYMVHLGLLSFGNNGETLANYKYLASNEENELKHLRGLKIQEGLLNPVSNLIMNKYNWLRIISRQSTNNQMYCGKGSTLFMKYKYFKTLQCFKIWIFSMNSFNYLLIKSNKHLKFCLNKLKISQIYLKNIWFKINKKFKKEKKKNL